MKKITVVLVTVLFLCGCYTQKKAVEQAEKGLLKFPIETGKVFRDKFPCVDGEVIVGDSAAIKAWMKATEETAAFYEELIKNMEKDTLKVVSKDISDSLKYIQCTYNYISMYDSYKLLKNNFEKLLKRPIPVIRDTIKVADTYDLAAAVSAKEKCEEDYRQLYKDKVKVEEQKKRSVIENWIWRAIAIILAIMFVIKLVK